MHAIVSKEDKRRKSVSSVRETITEVSDWLKKNEMIEKKKCNLTKYCKIAYI